MSSTPTRNRAPGPLDLPTPPANPFVDSALLTSTDNTPAGATPHSQPVSPSQRRVSRISFGRKTNFGHRKISVSSRKFARDEELANFSEDQDAPEERPPIPSALPDAQSTPLPILPVLVLCIAMLGEFLSANVSTPFLLFMVEGFNVAEDEAQVGYLTGVLASVFFITQFLTSLLWSTVANKHGVRAVLFVSLLGNAITCVIFGTSRTFAEAVVIRLAQGVFNGSVGVARGAIANITTPDNEGRAYAILGFCWGMGGVVGAIVGGAFESPANKFGGVFDSPFWRSYPYLLPTAIAAGVTLIGSFLSLFLAWDGGPRTGAIRLPEEKPQQQGLAPIPQEDEEDEDEEAMHPEDGAQVLNTPPTGLVHKLQTKVSKRLSGYFARRVLDHTAEAATPSPVQSPRGPVAGSRSVSGPAGRPRQGSAYGYRQRLGSSVSAYRTRVGSTAGTVRRRRSTMVGNRDGDEQQQEGEEVELGLAQRLLMANEFTVNSMGDLWVAAAVAAENENVFEDASEEDSDQEEDGEPETLRPGTARALEEVEQASPSVSPTRRGGRRSSSQATYRPDTTSTLYGFRRSSAAALQPQQATGQRRLSTASSAYVPAIYANTGLDEPPAMMTSADPFSEPLQSIVEGHVTVQDHAPEMTAPAAPSLWASLPLVIIFQYGLLALYNTVHDQVFYSYLVSRYNSGGLGLNPAQFATLIALMSLGQMVFQFYLYPNLGPPRGRFSHLAMFRIGSLLFIPAYLSVILYRVFTNENGDNNLLVMIGLSVSTAVRYCGATFTYTAVAVLINYMSPPAVIGLSNGLAQSVVSLARFVGPVLGGYLWSVSVQDHASGYAFGFFVVSAICAVAILHSLTIH